MISDTVRYVVPMGDTKKEYLKEDLELAQSLYQLLGCLGDIVLLVPNKDNVEHTTLAKAIGSEAIKVLKKKRSVSLAVSAT